MAEVFITIPSNYVELLNADVFDERKTEQRLGTAREIILEKLNMHTEYLQWLAEQCGKKEFRIGIEWDSRKGLQKVILGRDSYSELEDSKFPCFRENNLDSLWGWIARSVAVEYRNLLNKPNRRMEYETNELYSSTKK